MFVPNEQNESMDVPLIATMGMDGKANNTEAGRDGEENGRDESLSGLFSLPPLQAMGPVTSSLGRRLLLELAPEGEDVKESLHSEEDGSVGGRMDECRLKEAWVSDFSSKEESSSAVIGQPQQDLSLDEVEQDETEHGHNKSTIKVNEEEDDDLTSVEMQDQVHTYVHCLSIPRPVHACACVFVSMSTFAHWLWPKGESI